MALWLITKEIKWPYLNSQIDVQSIDTGPRMDRAALETLANADADLTLRGGTNGYDEDKLAGIVQHDFWVDDGTPGQKSPYTAAQQTAQERYTHALNRLRLIETQPVGFWNLEDDTTYNASSSTASHVGTRGDSYGRWAKMLSRACNVHGNFEVQARWDRLKGELDIDPRTWYWLHKADTWLAYNLNTFYYTTGDETTPNTRIGAVDANVTQSAPTGGIAQQLS